MPEAGTVVLSVRGDAQREVTPDLATLSCSVYADEREKAAALRTVTGRLEAVVDALRELGGRTRDAASPREALAWTARSATSRVETIWDHETDRQVATGRVLALVSLVIEVREFSLLAGLATALAAHSAVHVEGVEWSVDHDNPAWPQVRAAAIEAAIAKGRDYALALGGNLDRIDHVADVGLLGDSGPQEIQFAHAMAGGARRSKSSSHADEGDAPALDPVPLQLEAVIEARFSASVGRLA